MMQFENVPPSTFPVKASTRRPALGWGISLGVHAIAIAWLWHASPPPAANLYTEPAKQVVIWLVPAASKALPKAAAPVAPSNPALTRAAAKPSPTVRQSRFIAALEAPVVPQLPAVVASPPALATQNDVVKAADGQAPAFDLAAARASARALARAEDKGALPLRQENKEAITSERIQERFERARRVNCLKGKESVNLLANVLSIAKDIVANAVDDSGCKL